MYEHFTYKADLIRRFQKNDIPHKPLPMRFPRFFSDFCLQIWYSNFFWEKKYENLSYKADLVRREPPSPRQLEITYGGTLLHGSKLIQVKKKKRQYLNAKKIRLSVF